MRSFTDWGYSHVYYCNTLIISVKIQSQNYL